MAHAEVDALLLTPGPDLRYLTGLGDVHAGERLVALVLPRNGGGFWICPEMNRQQVEAHRAGVTDIRCWDDAAWYLPELDRAGLAGKRVAVDEEMRARFLLDLQARCAASRWTGAGDVMRSLRIKKEPEEILRLKRAGAAVDAVIPNARAACRPDVSEREAAEAIQSALTAVAPGWQPAFCIVAGGPNGALPHHDTGDRTIAPGDMIVVDYGGFLEGYVADITLTFCAGPPADQDAPRVYHVVWEAQQKAIEAVRPGATCGEIDRAARSHIEAAGFGEFFTHRTGHGVGLQIHEPPYLTAGNPEPLEEGMCFSIEPGIYLPGRMGVRLEVLVTVTGDGVELLNVPSAPFLVDR